MEMATMNKGGTEFKSTYRAVRLLLKEGAKCWGGKYKMSDEIGGTVFEPVLTMMKVNASMFNDVVLSTSPPSDSRRGKKRKTPSSSSSSSSSSNSSGGGGGGSSGSSSGGSSSSKKKEEDDKNV